MKNCKTCKNWDKWPNDPGFGLCLHFCLIKPDNTTIFPANKALKDLTPDDLGYTTGQNFGCVHHKE
jgi:hypothetical protein